MGYRSEVVLIVGKEVMPEAIETVLNMSEAMGTGLKESTVQLGKDQAGTPAQMYWRSVAFTA